MYRNNINLFSSDGNKFKYVVEINDTDEKSHYYYTDVDIDNSFKKNIYFSTDKSFVLKKVNNISQFGYEDEQDYKVIRKSIVKLYVPEYKPELYDNSIRYLIECYLYIDNTKVTLYSDVCRLTDSVANENIFKSQETTYYEYISFQIPSPSELLFSDDEVAKEFRIFAEDIDFNINSSCVNFNITPIDKEYNIHSFVNSGTTSVQLSGEETDYMKVLLETNTTTSTKNGTFYIEWKYNSHYSYDDEGLKEYLYETYHLEDVFGIVYTMVIFDKGNIYKTFSEVADVTPRFYFDRSKLVFGSWEYLDIPMSARCEIELVDIEGKILFTLQSEVLDITPDTFRFFAKEAGIQNINLDKQDMNNYNFNLVNKVQKNIIQVERPKDYKANIIKPVFYKVKDLSDLVINPEVTENISIQLNNYKSKTDVFFLQVEGVVFNEAGRTAAGVIFNVVGHQLPGALSEGTYYVLDKDRTLITSGKYRYV